jgi:hypothetical protein
VKRFALLLVALDDLGWTNIGIIRIQACIPTRPPLTQQIPTLVERDLELAKVGDVFLGRRGSSVSSLQRMLVLNKLADPVNDLDLVHAYLLLQSGHHISIGQAEEDTRHSNAPDIWTRARLANEEARKCPTASSGRRFAFRDGSL